MDEEARKRFAANIEEEAAGRGGESGKRLGELEAELKSDIERHREELTAALAATKAELEAQRATRTEEIVAAAQAVEARLADLKTGAAEETIVFEPTGEVIVAAGDKGGKTATARLRAVVGAETERVNEEIQGRERDEATAVDQKVADLRAAMDETLAAEKAQLKEQAQGLKDELRKMRDELESIKPMLTVGETELRDARREVQPVRQGPPVHFGHGRRGRARHHQPDGPRDAGATAARRGPDELRPAPQEGDQAPAPHRGVPPLRQPGRSG